MPRDQIEAHAGGDHILESMRRSSAVAEAFTSTCSKCSITASGLTRMLTTFLTREAKNEPKHTHHFRPASSPSISVTRGG